MNHKMMDTYARPDIVFNTGKGSWLYDTEGEAYLDLMGGVAVNALGHAHPALAKTIAEQASTLMHCSNIYFNDKQLRLAEQLTALSGMASVFFVNSGTESIEAGLKLARKYGSKIDADKNIIIYLSNSFHGRTMGALSVTGQPKYQKDFMPLLGATLCLPKDDPALLEAAFSDKVCGVIVEPIQGEGGIVPVNPAYIEKARELCDRYDALLIFDEVQCGLGRTGKMFAFENLTVKPDVVCLAKGLGGGFPIGAAIANERGSCFVKGDHGCTFGGNPLACAASLTVLEHLTAEGFLDKVAEKGQWAVKYITDRLSGNPAFVKVAGSGLILGIHLSTAAAPIVQAALKNKVLLVNAGPQVIRLVPALNITQEDWQAGVEKVCGLIEETAAN